MPRCDYPHLTAFLLAANIPGGSGGSAPRGTCQLKPPEDLPEDRRQPLGIRLVERRRAVAVDIQHA